MQKWKKQPCEFTQKKVENKARQAVYDALKNALLKANGLAKEYPEVTIDGKTVRITKYYNSAFHSGYALIRSMPRRGIGIHLAECNFSRFNSDGAITVKPSYGGEFKIPRRDILAFVISDEAISKATKIMEEDKGMTLSVALGEVSRQYDYW